MRAVTRRAPRLSALMLVSADVRNGWSMATSGVTSDAALPIHGYFLAAITFLFLLVFAITIYTMVRHGKIVDRVPNEPAGSTGALQWLWATVPFAILFFVDYALIGSHYNR